MVKIRPSELLVSGFKSFLLYCPKNPSEYFCKYINKVNPEVNTVVLPVTFPCVDILKEKIAECKPKLVLSFGYIYYGDKIVFETVAHNHVGILPDDHLNFRYGKIDKEGPNAIYGGVKYEDILSMETRLEHADVRCRVSTDAGKYLCNYLAYYLGQMSMNSSTKGMFIHIPMIDGKTMGILLDTIVNQSWISLV